MSLFISIHSPEANFKKAVSMRQSKRVKLVIDRGSSSNAERSSVVEVKRLLDGKVSSYAGKCYEISPVYISGLNDFRWGDYVAMLNDGKGASVSCWFSKTTKEQRGFQ